MKVPIISFGNKENAILQGVENHLGVVRQTIDDFQDLVLATGREDAEAAAASLQKVLDGEAKAKDLHRTLSMQIAQGAFFGGVREDILNLLQKIDDIADSAKDAARLIGQEQRSDELSRSVLSSEDMKKFLGNIIQTVSALATLIAAFKIGKSEVLARIRPVEESEEAADVNKVALYRDLFTAEGSPDPVTVIQMRDFIATSDDIADNAEDASDVVLVLVAKGYD